MLSCRMACLSDHSSPMEYELIVERISFRRMGPSASATRMAGTHLSPKRYFRSYSPRRNLSSFCFIAPPRALTQLPAASTVAFSGSTPPAATIWAVVPDQRDREVGPGLLAL